MNSRKPTIGKQENGASQIKFRQKGENHRHRDVFMINLMSRRYQFSGRKLPLQALSEKV